MNNEQSIKPIGGFYELELASAKAHYHPEAIKLSTGRACLRLLIQQFNIRVSYVPFYTCDAFLDPFYLENVQIKFYGIDSNLDPDMYPELKEGEYFFYINYFGIKNKTVDLLIEKYAEALIIDNTHNFFQKSYQGNSSFTTARKYFGVPDGAYLYSTNISAKGLKQFEDISIEANVLRLCGKQQASYSAYEFYERRLTSEVNTMSCLSDKLLSQIDYDLVKNKRIENFRYLHAELGSANNLVIDIDESTVAFAYPFLPGKMIDKKEFYKENLFIPTLWADPANREGDGFEFDKDFGLKILPLPIDHRYDKMDMQRLIDKVLTIINN